MKKGERRAFDILFRLGCLVVAIAAILIWRLAELPHFGPAVGAILVLFFLVSGTVPGLLRYRTIGKSNELGNIPRPGVVPRFSDLEIPKHAAIVNFV